MLGHDSNNYFYQYKAFVIKNYLSRYQVLTNATKFASILFCKLCTKVNFKNMFLRFINNLYTNQICLIFFLLLSAHVSQYLCLSVSLSLCLSVSLSHSLVLLVCISLFFLFVNLSREKAITDN
jgi:hypothetical protein